MTNTHASISHLSDDELLAQVHLCVADERHATARLIASLAELDARRLYLGAGCSSLFTYCTQLLHLSEHAAYHRIEAARAARGFPVILDLLAEGSVHLTAIGLLASHLTPENHREVLAAARHKSKREIEHLVATLWPKPAIPSTVRKLPASSGAANAAAPSPCSSSDPAEALSTAAPLLTTTTAAPRPARPASTVSPLSTERYKLQCTITRETYEKLCRARDLLRHSIPNGEPAEILDRALTLLVADLERKRLAATGKPRPRAREAAKRSRYIAADVKRAVWARDGGRCAFVGTEGRCSETGFLEIHHVVPYASGGEAVAANLQLRCRAHNAHEAERYFGSGQLSFVRETHDIGFG